MTTLVGTWTAGQYARASILRGVASSFDLRGNTVRQYRTYSTSEEINNRAVQSDWEVVGSDLRAAVGHYTAGR